MLNVHHISTVASITGDEFGEIGVGITLMLVGMFVVFATLLIIMFLITGIAKLIGEEVSDAPSATPDPVGAVTSSISATHVPQPSSEEGLVTPEIIAVITAAAVTVLGKTVRVRGVTLINSPGGAWLSGGRARLMSSHSPTRQHHKK